MLPIQSIKCIYDTGGRTWSIELKLDAEGEAATRRFEVDGAEDAEMLIEAFEDSSAAEFDPESGEIVFAYEYAMMDEDDEEESEEDEDSEEDDEEDETSDEDEGKERK